MRTFKSARRRTPASRSGGSRATASASCAVGQFKELPTRTSGVCGPLERQHLVMTVSRLLRLRRSPAAATVLYGIVDRTVTRLRLQRRDGRAAPRCRSRPTGPSSWSRTGRTAFCGDRLVAGGSAGRQVRRLRPVAAANSGHDARRRPRPLLRSTHVRRCPRPCLGGVGARQGRGAGRRGAQARARRAGAAAAGRRRGRRSWTSASSASSSTGSISAASSGRSTPIPRACSSPPAGRRTAGAATLPPTPPTPDAGRFVFLRPAAPVRASPPAADPDEEVCDFHPQRRRKGTMDPGEYCDGSGWIVDAVSRESRACRCRPLRIQRNRDRRLGGRVTTETLNFGLASSLHPELHPALTPVVRRWTHDIDGHLRDGRGLWMTVGPWDRQERGGDERGARRCRPAAADPGGVRAGRRTRGPDAGRRRASPTRRAPSAARAPVAS